MSGSECSMTGTSRLRLVLLLATEDFTTCQGLSITAFHSLLLSLLSPSEQALLASLLAPY